MNRAEIEEKVRSILIEDLEVDESKVFPEASLKEDMEIDSLDFVDIVVYVEKTFAFKIEREEMVGIKTFRQFCDYVEKKLSK